MNIVLIQPEIPQNTGNIARTCAALGATLHLVKPLGFEISDKYVKRAGLDYWDKLDIKIYENIDEFMEINEDKKMYMYTTKGKKRYTDVKYNLDDFLVFGPETRGIDESLLEDNFDNALRIPMRENIRSINLSNSVAVVVYEAFRQNDFNGLEVESHYFDKKEGIL